MLIFLPKIFTIITIQHLCNLSKHNILSFINFVLLIYFFISSKMYICIFVHVLFIRMHSVWLCYIHCLCVMSYLMKPEFWTSIKHVKGTAGLHGISIFFWVCLLAFVYLDLSWNNRMRQ